MLTIAPSLSHGGHFYSSHTLNRTLHARRLEHIHLDTLTKASHPRSWVLLQRMMLYAHQKIVVEKGSSPYPLEDLAALILLCQDSYLLRNHAETVVSHGFHLQKEKAILAAKIVRQQYTSVHPILHHMVQQLVAWGASLVQDWDEEVAFYVPPGRNPETFFAQSKIAHVSSGLKKEKVQEEEKEDEGEADEEIEQEEIEQEEESDDLEDEYQARDDSETSDSESD